MATPSDAPPSSTDEKPQNPVSQVTQRINDGHTDTNKLEGVKESSPSSVFMNSEPIREEQVQNAVKFLSHPKVIGSPVIYRRSFLERKGLTKEEIDEAFRRVPDPSPAVTTTPPVVSNQDGQVKSSSNGQQQPPAQVLQPIGPVGSDSKMGIVSRLHWYHAILAVGFLAASGAGTAVLFKNTIVPRLKSWIRKVVLEEDEEGLKKENIAKPNIAEEAANAAKSAAAAAADVARASQEMLLTRSEEKRCFEELINMLSVQANEMKSMSNAIQKLEGGQSINGRVALEEPVFRQKLLGTSSWQQQPYTNGKADADSSSVRSLSPSASVEPSAAPHPKSYMDIMSMIQRGEKPSNIREINDAPPNPNQPVSNPRLAPRPKPWESNNHPQNTSFNTTMSSIPDRIIKPSDYVDYQPNEDTAPGRWMQQKTVKITEIGTGDEQKSGSQNVLSNERRSWVPPQPPHIAMPEAAAVIRQQPKKSSILNDDQLSAQQTDVTDELQRITKISESGGDVDANSESSGVQSSEIAKEENGSYLET